MKTDASFKLVAVIILAGVLAAFVDPSPAAAAHVKSAATAHAESSAAPAAATE